MEFPEQSAVLENDKKNMLISASAGSGKTYIMIKYISQLICAKKAEVKDLLVLTFTKVAAAEMKERLVKSLKEKGNDKYIAEQIDSLSVANISTIDAFCEKCLKKYSNLLGLNENFSLADEGYSQKIKKRAIKDALKEFSEISNEEYLELMSCYKNNVESIEDIIFDLENFGNSVADKDLFFEKQITGSEDYFEKAKLYLRNSVLNDLSKSIKLVEELHCFDFECAIKDVLNKFFKEEDFFKFTNIVESIKLPVMPKGIDDDTKNNITEIKKDIKKIFEKIEELDLNNSVAIDYQKHGNFEKILLKLYYIYENSENKIKKLENCLDFNDLEKYMKILSQKEELFSGIKYVFIDEYQDTNKIQERIVKSIAKNSNFVAVGDVKQGIYGFRLASSDIFLKDIEDFGKAEDSTVKNLKSNFRSSQKVLDFVNDIFKVCMTEENSGINYLKSSMSEARNEFLDDGCKAVNIDIVKEDEENPIEFPKVYSVKNAEMIVENKKTNQLLQIKNRIMEVLSSKIYTKDGYRQARYSDIAILSRGRDPFYNQLEKYLRESDIPVISNTRKILKDEPEIQMLINYLKIILSFDDDVALLSVLMSYLTDITIDDIFELKQGSEIRLCDLVQNSKLEKFSNFMTNYNKFKKNYEIFGIYNAFLQLFQDVNYFSKLNFAKQGYIKFSIKKFLNEIKVSENEYDLPTLINYFEETEIVVDSESSAVEDAVLLTTIHNSKGLEYPIVFLIGCDSALRKNNTGNLEVDEDFGLALKYYDKTNNQEVKTVRMVAIKDKKSKKNFIEELFIFYVALTRAQNRLYLFGGYDEKEKFGFDNCNSYFDLIFYAMPFLREEIKNNCSYSNENIEINIVEKITEKNIKKIKNEINSLKNSTNIEKINNYLNFKYNLDKKLNFKLKETVTNLNKKDKENLINNFSNDSFTFGGKNIEIGNAYHLALKTVDFDKVDSMNSLKDEISNHMDIFENILDLIDLDILLDNILLLKPFTKDARIYKEKEFLFKDKISNILQEEDLNDEILVQGIIDLFLIKEKEIVLIDYKFSNSNSDSYLIEKYKDQLKLYKMALENAFKLPVNNAYLLSLKYNKLIKVEI